MNVSGWELVAAGIIAALILISGFALWLVGRSKGGN